MEADKKVERASQAFIEEIFAMEEAVKKGEKFIAQMYCLQMKAFKPTPRALLVSSHRLRLIAN